MATLIRDLRFAIRVLARSPVFTAVAILSLALGIGANAAIFTLLNALVYRELPVRNPERLVRISLVRPDGKFPFSYHMFRELERGQRGFNGLVGFDLGYQWHTGKLFTVEANGALSQSRILAVSGNFYSELGVTPMLGRLLTPEDADSRGDAGSEAAVISYEFWRTRFGGASSAAGKLVRIEGHPFVIVGVTRPWFPGMTPGEPPDITIPLAAAPVVQDGAAGMERGGSYWIFITGRLKDGVSLEAARAQLDTFWPEVSRTSHSAAWRERADFVERLELTPAATGVTDVLRSQFTRPLQVLAGIGGLALLAACVNLASLMLARAAARSRELCVRATLGASRWALVREAATESLLLSSAGAVLGLAFAYGGSRVLLLQIARRNPLPLSFDLSPDGRVLFFTAALALLTGILSGIVPAWRSSQQDPALTLQRGTPTHTGRRGAVGKALIVCQMALSLVLLMAAGLLARSFGRLSSADAGFDTEHVLEVLLYPAPGGYVTLDKSSYHRELLERISRVPGVVSAAYSNNSFVGGMEEGWREEVSSESDERRVARRVRSFGTMVSPGFFRTLGIGLLRGREFGPADDERHPRVAILSSGLAERLFPHGDAVGRFVRIGNLPGNEKVEIVGVSRPARILDVRDASAPVIFLPDLQIPQLWGAVVVRTREAPEVAGKAVGEAVLSLGHEYPFWSEPMGRVMGRQLVNERVAALLSGFFALAALGLAAMGLYGLLSFTVTHRTRELGIRAALGARRGSVLWLVLRETLSLALMGIAIGIPGALAGSRQIAGMLYGLASSDVETLAAASAFLVLVALLSGYLPARRAAGVDPAIALRAE